ncbi:hypothetical protein [Streptomyces sp. enrichment culture]|uniref:hypothetical protein n=1 Tax=Streptomyces sp. enrichment culture TaxID=1795815 RepID=UPI003F5676B7
MTDRATTVEPDLTELAPLVRVVTGALHETPLTLGTPAGIADLAATITVRVAAYVGREVLPLGPPADRAALHGRLVSALDTAFRTFVSPLSDAVPEGVELSDHLADAVLAVLPEQVDRAAVRAETLLEAADIAESLRQFQRTTGSRSAAQVSENVGILRVTEKLRRLASEQPQPDCGAAQRPAGLTVPALAGAAALTGNAPPYDQLPDADRERYLGQAWQLLARANGG